MWSSFLTLLKRDLTLAFSERSAIYNPVVFFLITVSLFPFALGNHTALLQQIGAGMIWIVLLLATMLPLPFLFEEDYQDGSLEQLQLSNIWLPLVIVAKIAAYWLTTALPLLILSPLLGLMLSLSPSSLLLLIFSLLLGTPSLSALGTVTAALAVGSRKGSSLITLITLPLTIPVLIMGCIASSTEATALQHTAFLLLGAFLLISLPLALLAGSAALGAALRYR